VVIIITDETDLVCSWWEIKVKKRKSLINGNGFFFPVPGVGPIKYSKNCYISLALNCAKGFRAGVWLLRPENVFLIKAMGRPTQLGASSKYWCPGQQHSYTSQRSIQ